MRRQMLTLVLAIGPAAAALALPAAAYECSYGVARPYVIEKICDEDTGACTARMLYAPGENPGLARHGSYWYQRSAGYVKVSPPECFVDPGDRDSENGKSSGEGPDKQV